MSVVERARQYVLEECSKPTSKYGMDPYSFHFVPMHDSAVELAEKLGADVEIVELAAWLHDIGSIVHGRKNHHVTGTEIAEKKLTEWQYDAEKIERVKSCILSHRGSQSIKSESLEAQIIADADAMSNFENIPGIFHAAFIYEGLNQGEARESTWIKLNNKWNQLSPSAKELIRDKYEAAKLLFSR